VLVVLLGGAFYFFALAPRASPSPEEKTPTPTLEEVPTPSLTPTPTPTPTPTIEEVTLPEMVLIPAGTFKMGGERFFWEDGTEWPIEEVTYDERPLHQVSIDSFYLSKYETTIQQFKEFIDETGYVTTAEKQGFCEALIGTPEMEFTEQKIKGGDWRHPLGPNDDISGKLNHPVACVSWIDAVNYLNWLSKKENLEPAYFYDEKGQWQLNPNASGYRLPTEAEWEYAAIGGNEKISFPWLDPSKRFWIFPWGNPGEGVKEGEHMNVYQLGSHPDQYEYTAPVGSFSATGYGLYDMAGNIAEWVNDWYSDEYYQYCTDHNITKNPLGPKSGLDKVHRGGSWATCGCWTRTTDRAGVNPDRAYNYIGFRIAKNLKNLRANLDTPRCFALRSHSMYCYCIISIPIKYKKYEEIGFQTPSSKVELYSHPSDNPQTRKDLRKMLASHRD